MSDNQVIVLTAAQLKEFAQEVVAEVLSAKAEADAQQQAEPKRYVYGLRGIRNLFNVSHTTAQRYKNTFLAPAVMQRGRNIVVDADYAISLYKEAIS